MEESVLLDTIGTDVRTPHKCGRFLYELNFHNCNMIWSCSKLIVENNNDAEFCNLCQNTYILDKHEIERDIHIRWK
jgi:hypothetical protein